MGEFRNLCVKEKMNELGWPAREYIVQIARFDPSKGIPNVIDSYARFRKLLLGKATEDEIPQLLICGHGAVDDPDASIIYDQVANLVHTKYAQYAKDIVYMRCPPSDQREHGAAALLFSADTCIRSAQRAHGELQVRTAAVDPRGLRGQGLRSAARGQAGHRVAHGRYPAPD